MTSYMIGYQNAEMSDMSAGVEIRRASIARTNSPLAIQRKAMPPPEPASPLPRLRLGSSAESSPRESETRSAFVKRPTLPTSSDPREQILRSAVRLATAETLERGCDCLDVARKCPPYFYIIALLLFLIFALGVVSHAPDVSAPGHRGALGAATRGAAAWRAQTMPKAHCRSLIAEAAVRGRNVSLALLKKVHAPRHPLIDDMLEEAEAAALSQGDRPREAADDARGEGLPAVAIIVPIRHQYTAMVKLLWSLHPMLQCQGVRYWVYVVEQAAEDTAPFDLDALRNAGAQEAMKEFLWDCIAFHDVDLVPLDARCPYNCKERPTILATAKASQSSVALISRNQFFAIDGFATPRRQTLGAMGRSAPHPALRSIGASLPAPFGSDAMEQRLKQHGLLPLITPPTGGHCAFISTESATVVERRQWRVRRVRDGASAFARDAARDAAGDAAGDIGGGAAAGRPEEAARRAASAPGLREPRREGSYTLRDTVHHALFTRWRFAFDAPASPPAQSAAGATGANSASARSASAATTPAAPAPRVVAVEKATEAMVKILKLRAVRTGVELDAMTPNEVRDTLKVEAIESLHDREHEHLNMWNVTDADLLFLASKLGVAWQESEERWGPVYKRYSYT